MPESARLRRCISMLNVSRLGFALALLGITASAWPSPLGGTAAWPSSRSPSSSRPVLYLTVAGHPCVSSVSRAPHATCRAHTRSLWDGRCAATSTSGGTRRIPDEPAPRRPLRPALSLTSTEVITSAKTLLPSRRPSLLGVGNGLRYPPHFRRRLAGPRVTSSSFPAAPALHRALSVYGNQGADARTDIAATTSLCSREPPSSQGTLPTRVFP